jgi:hypothetical protein
MLLTSVALLLWASALLLTVAAVRAYREAFVRTPLSGEGTAPLSVVIAAHNEATRIPGMLELVLQQDHPDFEVVVVDDRSRDETLSEARRAAKGDPRVRFLRVDETPKGWQGRLYAQSVGVAGSHREWLLFMSADHRIASLEFFRGILAEYQRRDVAAASVLGPFVGRRWWQTWWFRPIAENPVLLGCIFLWQRLRPDTTWLIGALAMRRQTYEAIGGAGAAASYGAGVFDDWGWTRAFEMRHLRTAMVYHSALQDISNWQSLVDGWDGLSRWAAGILTSRRGAWLGALILAIGVSAFSIATAKVLFDLASFRIPALASLALAAIPPTVGVAYCRWHGHRVLWALLSSPLSLFMLAPLGGGAWARLRNRIRWRDQELMVVTEPPTPGTVDTSTKD